MPLNEQTQKLTAVKRPVTIETAGVGWWKLHDAAGDLICSKLKKDEADSIALALNSHDALVDELTTARRELAKATAALELTHLSRESYKADLEAANTALRARLEASEAALRAEEADVANCDKIIDDLHARLGTCEAALAQATAERDALDALLLVSVKGEKESSCIMANYAGRIAELENQLARAQEALRENIISANIIQAEVVQAGVNRHGIWRDLDFIRSRSNAAAPAPFVPAKHGLSFAEAASGRRSGSAPPVAPGKHEEGVR